jgi:hypothetical protein
VWPVCVMSLETMKWVTLFNSATFQFGPHDAIVKEINYTVLCCNRGIYTCSAPGTQTKSESVSQFCMDDVRVRAIKSILHE